MGGPSCCSAALRLLGELAQGGSRQAGALLALRMAWTPQSDPPRHLPPDRPLSPGETFLLSQARVAEAANLRRGPEFQPRALQGPGSPGPSWVSVLGYSEISTFPICPCSHTATVHYKAGVVKPQHSKS